MGYRRLSPRRRARVRAQGRKIVRDFLFARQREAPTVRYQWSNGNRLMLVPLSDKLWKLLRRLGGSRAKYETFLQTWARANGQPGAVYVALHYTGPRPRSKPGCKYWRHQLIGMHFSHIYLGKGWWMGPHLARPKPSLLVVTEALGTLDGLRPPKMSLRWALEVESFTCPGARAWARKDAR